jgi:CHAT domain-containing protein/tetratricopeptide (TPR) repeat protein
MTEPDDPVAILERVFELSTPEEVPRRIELCRRALRLVKREQDPVLWASLQGELGASLAGNPYGDRSVNYEEAIAAFEQALRVLTREGEPIKWAHTISNLANAYSERLLGDRAENLERAIEGYRAALGVLDRERHPPLWARTIHNLAAAYVERLLGDRADNLEQAIDLYQQALRVRTRAAMPARWAQTTSSLAVAYMDRVHGDRADNLERAIELFEHALGVRTRVAMPIQWATTTHNLANAYSARPGGNRSAYRTRAIELLRQVLEVRTRAALPYDWAATMSSLGNAQLGDDGDQPRDPVGAVRSFREALEVRERAADPVGWASLQHNLGVAFTVLSHEQESAVEAATHHYRQALEVFTAEGFPGRNQAVLNDLGDLHFNRRDWTRALAACAGAIEAGELALAQAHTETGRVVAVTGSWHLHARVAYCLLRLRRPGEALVRLEHGKARVLAEVLGLTDAALERVPEARRGALLDAGRRVRELEAELRLPAGTPARRGNAELSRLLREARRTLSSRLEGVAAQHPGSLPGRLDLASMLALVPVGGALVVPLITSQGGAAFVIPHGASTVTAEHVLWLDGLTDRALLDLLGGPIEDPALGGWLGAYLEGRLAIAGRGGTLSLPGWQQTIEAFTERVWSALMGPVHRCLAKLRLPSGAPLTIVPHGGLGLLPLHAARRAAGEAGPSFIDDYTVGYTPSLYVLSVSRRRAQDSRRARPRLLAIVDPTADLRYALLEGEAVAATFADDGEEPTVLPREQATHTRLLEEMAGATHLHFACHGWYAWGQATDSGLLLAGGRRLTLSEILAPSFDLEDARLVVLSACETGLIGMQQSPDEFVGLPAGFLQAGSLVVVSSLWAVDDLSTSLLMDDFYRRHVRQGQRVAAALREAQRWLRDCQRNELLAWVTAARDAAAARARAGDRDARASWARLDGWREALLEDYGPDDRPFLSPYYWAAFTVTGAAQ